MVKELYNLFTVQKIYVKKGSLVRAGSKLDSKKVINLPENSLVALPIPIISKVIDNKTRVQIIHPVKGWVFEEDLTFLDTIEYLRYGSKYYDFIVERMKDFGIEHIMENTEIIDEKNIEVFIMPTENIFDLENDKKKNNKDTNDTSMRKFSEIYAKEIDKDKKNRKELATISLLNKSKYENEMPILKIPVIILSGSSWCEPCQNLKSILIELVGTIKDIKLYILDNDIEPELVEEMKLKAMSNILFYSDGKQVGHLLKTNYTQEKLEKILLSFKENYNKHLPINITENK
jgi:thiol-disulfide isomerase/thioredoxin